MPLPRFTTAQRRARLVARHRLRGDASSVLDAARAVLVLHATDPATVFLSAMARCGAATLADVAQALYDDRSLVRLLAMRRTLFVAPLEVAPVVHHAASLDVAAQQRRRLLAQLATLPTEPPLPADLEGWLRDVEAGVVAALEARGTAVGAQLSEDEPRLRTAIMPTTDKAYDVRRNVTTQVLTLMGADGRIVRGRPRGSWLSRQHVWEPVTRWWPEGIPAVHDAKAALVAAYLARFGPATEIDVAWWTGWAKGVTRKALVATGAEQVELEHGGVGWVAAGDHEHEPEEPDLVALLPALDPTPMGWKERTWFSPEDVTGLYDAYGNIGPTVWLGGRVVGAWATSTDGSVRTRLVAALSPTVLREVELAARTLEKRLEGAVVVPSFPTPIETALRKG